MDITKDMVAHYLHCSGTLHVDFEGSVFCDELNHLHPCSLPKWSKNENKALSKYYATSGYAHTKLIDKGLELESSIDQPPPVKNDRPPVWDAVIKDMHERHEVGVKRYGTALQPFNGRAALEDAYAESLDQVVYLRQRIEEQKEMVEKLDKACVSLALHGLYGSQWSADAYELVSSVRDMLKTNRK